MENDHAALNVNAEQKLQRELSVEERIEQYAAIKNKQFFGIGDALGFLLASISADAFSPTMDSSDFAHIALSTADGLLAKHPKRSEFLAWMNSSTKDSRSVSQRNLGLSFGLLSYFGQSKDWSFWSEWYQGFLDGKPMDWELQRRVALIDDHFWEAGPEAVAEEIERIRTRYDVETALNDLAEAQSVVQRSRRGIGGNNPPEAIEDAPVLERHVKLIWNGVDILAEEVKAEEPDKARVEAALGMLKTGLAACLKWCGRKGDLAVDTLIKWGVPVGASGYLALNPDKVRALIEAVEAWVPFL